MSMTKATYIHPAVRVLFEEMDRQGRTNFAEFGREVGMEAYAVKRWKAGLSTPRVDSLEAALNCVGFRLAVVPLEEEK